MYFEIPRIRTGNDAYTPLAPLPVRREAQEAVHGTNLSERCADDVPPYRATSSSRSSSRWAKSQAPTRDFSFAHRASANRQSPLKTAPRTILAESRTLSLVPRTIPSFQDRSGNGSKRHGVAKHRSGNATKELNRSGNAIKGKPLGKIVLGRRLRAALAKVWL